MGVPITDTYPAPEEAKLNDTYSVMVCRADGDWQSVYLHKM